MRKINPLGKTVKMGAAMSSVTAQNGQDYWRLNSITPTEGFMLTPATQAGQFNLQCAPDNEGNINCNNIMMHCKPDVMNDNIKCHLVQHDAKGDTIADFQQIFPVATDGYINSAVVTTVDNPTTVATAPYTIVKPVPSGKDSFFFWLLVVVFVLIIIFIIYIAMRRKRARELGVANM